MLTDAELFVEVLAPNSHISGRHVVPCSRLSYQRSKANPEAGTMVYGFHRVSVMCG